MSKFKNICVFVFLSLIAVGMFGCEKEGPMESAGKAVDEAVDDTEKTVSDTKEKMEDAVKE